MREWLGYQGGRGNQYAVESGSRLLEEFGDVPKRLDPAERIWITARTLVELQQLPRRSQDAERVVVDSLTGQGHLTQSDEIKRIYEKTYRISASTWAHILNPDTLIAADGENDSHFVNFKGFYADGLDNVNGDPISSNVWMLFVEDQDGNEWRVPVDSLEEVVAVSI